MGWPLCQNGITSCPKVGTRKLFWRRKASGETTKLMGRCHTKGCSQPAPDRNWKVAARDKEEWRKKFGEAMARKRAEAP
jgi:hypothetical protein